MGACSSRPSVLDDESGRVPAPVPQVEETAPEAEVYEDTLEHDPEEVPAEESKAGDGSEELEAPAVVENVAIEAEAAPVAEEPQNVEAALLAAEDSDKVESAESVEGTETDQTPAELAKAHPVEDKTPAEPVEANPNEDKTPAEPIEANPGEEAAAAPKDEGTPEFSESPAAGGNPFQSFMSNVTKGWGWR